jgi:hypothetical protein
MAPNWGSILLSLWLHFPSEGPIRRPVLCERGNNLRVAKGFVVKQARGVGMILYNIASDGEGLIVDPHLLPATVVGSIVGDSIYRYILSKENPTAAITFHGTKLGVKPPHVVASFSIRGPNP